jgi:ribokinase
MVERFEVAVVGSLHLDIMVKGPHLPRLDETVIGSAWGFKCGGKGGNQAVAAAHAGARTGFVGAIGEDDFGRRLRDNLLQAEIDCSRLVVERNSGSGMSVAIQDAQGGYCAVVVSGANLAIDRNQFQGVAAKVLLLQNEIGPEISAAAAEAFARTGAYVIHNAAPFRPGPRQFADLVVVNRIEAAAMAGFDVVSVPDAIRAAGTIAGAFDAIVTLGSEGCVVATRHGEQRHLAADKVAVVSSHGAGDAYCGTLAAAIAKGADIAAAAREASTAAARRVAEAADWADPTQHSLSRRY